MCDCWPLHGLEKGQVIKDGWMDRGMDGFSQKCGFELFFSLHKNLL